MGVLEVKKLIGDGPMCPTCVLHVSGTCICSYKHISSVSCPILMIFDFIEISNLGAFFVDKVYKCTASVCLPSYFQEDQ